MKVKAACVHDENVQSTNVPQNTEKKTIVWERSLFTPHGRVCSMFVFDTHKSLREPNFPSTQIPSRKVLVWKLKRYPVLRRSLSVFVCLRIERMLRLTGRVGPAPRERFLKRPDRCTWKTTTTTRRRTTSTSNHKKPPLLFATITVKRKRKMRHKLCGCHRSLNSKRKWKMWRHRRKNP